MPARQLSRDYAIKEGSIFLSVSNARCRLSSLYPSTSCYSTLPLRLCSQIVVFLARCVQLFCVFIVGCIGDTAMRSASRSRSPVRSAICLIVKALKVFSSPPHRLTQLHSGNVGEGVEWRNRGEASVFRRGLVGGARTRRGTCNCAPKRLAAL